MQFLLDLGYSWQECVDKDRITFQVYSSRDLIFAVWFSKKDNTIIIGDSKKKTFMNNVKSTTLAHDLKLVHEIVEHYLH